MIKYLLKKYLIQLLLFDKEIKRLIKEVALTSIHRKDV